jgi:hypothetical protein
MTLRPRTGKRFNHARFNGKIVLILDHNFNRLNSETFSYNKPKTSLKFMVRGVGFEPTNLCRTGSLSYRVALGDSAPLAKLGDPRLILRE